MKVCKVLRQKSEKDWVEGLGERGGARQERWMDGILGEGRWSSTSNSKPGQLFSALRLFPKNGCVNIKFSCVLEYTTWNAMIYPWKY